MSYVYISYFVRIVSTILLLLVPFRNHFRFSKRITITFAASACTVGLLCAFAAVSVKVPHSNGRMVFSILITVAITVCFLIGFKMRPNKLLFIILVVKGYSDDIAFLADILVFPTDRAFIVCGSAPEQVFLYVVTFFPMYFFIRRLICPLVDLEGDRPFWRFLWLIPCAFFFVYRIGVNPAYLGNSIVGQGDILLLYFSWTSAMFLTFFVILRMLADTARVADLQERLRVSELQIRMQNDTYGLIKDRMEMTHRMRHDLRHHLLAVKGYAAQQDCAAILVYINSCLNSAREQEPISYCANYAVNAIVCHYLSSMQDSGTQMDIEISMPEELAIRESNVCIVMGNLIENAAESCSRQVEGKKFIRVRAALAGEQMLAITVANSYSGDIRIQDGIFLSSKREGKGYGVESVRCIVEQCNGVAKFSFSNGIFTASVLMSPSSEWMPEKNLM